MTIALTRQQRRQMQRLAGAADRAIEGDRRFFLRHPTRAYRVRLISQAERQQAEIIQGGAIVPAPDQAVFVAIKQLAKGVRLKVSVVGSRAYIGDELTDDEARNVFESFADLFPAIRDREAAMLSAYQSRPDGPSQS